MKAPQGLDGVGRNRTQKRTTPRRRPRRIEPLETRRLTAVLPDGFSETEVGPRLPAPPVNLAQVPDGRFLITTDDNDDLGTILVIKDGELTDRPALSIPIVSPGEQGMVGMVLAPDFDQTGHLYVMYTTDDGGRHNRLSRFTMVGDTIDPDTEFVVLDLDPLGNGVVHNGGGMAFGGDGKLYVGVGDNQFGPHAQDLTNRFGSILRINPDGTIPNDNPFYNRLSGPNRAIYAHGVRNPFNMDADPETGRIFFSDVGPANPEEINELIPGGNYGWPEEAGNSRDPDHTNPIYAYRHKDSTPEACAITGGRFYRPAVETFPAEYRDRFYFSDYCGAWIDSYDLETGTVERFASDLGGLTVSPFVGHDGALYYLSRANRRLYKIQSDDATDPGGPGNPNGPILARQPESLRVAVGDPATFRVAVNDNGPFQYQWQRRDAGATTFTDIAGATSDVYTLEPTTAADTDAAFRVLVSFEGESTTSNAATLTVVDAAPPLATITSPTGDDLYRAGDVITFAGSAVDGDGDPMDAADLEWVVDFFHDEHHHPFLSGITGVDTGTFTIPTVGETDANVWYRLYLTATDDSGLQHTAIREIFPVRSTFTLASEPAGIELTFDGTPIQTPLPTLGVAGIERTIGAPTTATIDGTEYAFLGWSDGRSRTHTIATPDVDTTYTAVYEPVDDDPNANPVRLSIADASVTETDTGDTRLRYAITADRPSDSDITVRVSTADGTATAGSDYDARTDVLVTLPAGETLVGFPVAVTGDRLIEPDETLTATLTDARLGGVGGESRITIADATATGTIVNDDEPDGPPITLSIADATVTEPDTGRELIRFAVTADRPSDADITFRVSTADGTATAGTDYEPRTDILVTLPAGRTLIGFPVWVSGDTFFESDETLTATISDAALDGIIHNSLVTVTRDTATGTIINNDDETAPSPITLSIADASVTELDTGRALLRYAITADRQSDTDITVRVSTADGTATPGDYTPRTNVLVTLPAGRTVVGFPVWINGDTTFETDETFTATLSDPRLGGTADPRAVTIGAATATGTILNNDPPPSNDSGDDPDPGTPPGPADPITHLAFDSFNGSDTPDSAATGTPDPGTLAAGATPITDGRFGGGVRFDGVDDFVTIADTPDINGSDVAARTITLWFRPDAPTRDGKQVLFKQGGSSRGLNVYLSDGRLHVAAWSGKANWPGTYLASDPLQPGRWYHAALTIDAPERLTPNTLTGYLNGVAFASGPAAAVQTHRGNISLGSLDQSTRFHDVPLGSGQSRAAFTGTIDDFRVYDRALTPSEITSLSATPTARTDVNTDGVTTPLDALQILNRLRRQTPQSESTATNTPALTTPALTTPAHTTPELSTPVHSTPDPHDINGDGLVTPLDALMVLNALRRRSTTQASPPITAQSIDEVLATPQAIAEDDTDDEHDSRRWQWLQPIDIALDE